MFVEDYLDDDPDAEAPMLKPKVPRKDDPRLKIPQGKATAAHDHLIVSKEPIPNNDES